MTPAPTSTSTRPPARERLLDAAEQLFHEQGIAATGVDAVLARAGVAPATLYAHFRGKDDLVGEALHRRLERWRSTWDAVLERCGDDADARVLSVFDALEEFTASSGSSRGCAFLAASVEVVDPDHPAHRWLVEDTRLLRERVGSLVAESAVQDPDGLGAELLLLYDGALAARARRGLEPTGGPVSPTPRELAAAALARHRGRTPGASGTSS